MDDKIPMSKDLISLYLRRIGFWENPLLGKDTLDELVYCHQCSIPFSTIDMFHCSEPPDIHPDTVFHKLISLKRGGYCFELNLIFEILLNNLGFKARSILGRFGRRDENAAINHQSVLVELNGQLYITDVGIGGPLAAGALPLIHGEDHLIRGERFVTRQLDETWWAIDRMTQGKRDLYGDEGELRLIREIEVCTAQVKHKDFVALNAYLSQPGQFFADTVVANLRTPDGYYAIMDDVLTIRKDGEKVKQVLKTKQKFDEAVEHYFGFKPK